MWLADMLSLLTTGEFKLSHLWYNLFYNIRFVTVKLRDLYASLIKQGVGNS